MAEENDKLLNSIGNSGEKTSSNSEAGNVKGISSYQIFEKCIQRSKNLLFIRESTDQNEAILEEHYCDCYRASIVLSISALDAFIRKVIISEILNILNSNKRLEKGLSLYIKNLLGQDSLLEAARKHDLSARVEKAIKEDFQKKSFQGEWKISHHMEMIGHKNIYKKVSEEEDINEGRLRANLMKYTKRRHVIVHSGDYDLNSSPFDEMNIDRKFAESCIETVTVFAKGIHKIIEDK